MHVNATQMYTTPPGPVDYIAVFMPSVYMPPESFPSLVGGMTLLFICIFTTTFTQRYAPLLAVCRMVLSVPAIYLFVDHAANPTYLPKPTRGTWLGMGTIGCYGVMRILECCWVPLFDKAGAGDQGRPRWVYKADFLTARRRSQEKGTRTPQDDKSIDSNAVPTRDSVTVSTLPLPTTFVGRFIYSFDLLTSLRGSSWYGDRVWDWAPLSAASYRSPVDRRGYLLYQAIYLAIQYLAYDTMDTYSKSIHWNTQIPNPVTSTPFFTQALTAVSVCVLTVLSITIPYSVLSSLFVVGMGSNPNSWPPMFDYPLYAKSLSEFWTFRWHHMFRRVFGRLSQPILNICVPSSISPKGIQTVRRILIFAFSTFLHLVLMDLPPISELHPHTFWNHPTLKFFLSQSLGLIIESVVVAPLTSSLPDGWLKNSIRRGFAWGWLLWTGRWWSDVWVGRGLYDEGEKPIRWSPVRGMMRGEWAIYA